MTPAATRFRLSQRTSAVAAGTLLLMALAACGQKGPLYMPPPDAPDASLTTPPNTPTPTNPGPDAVTPVH